MDPKENSSWDIYGNHSRENCYEKQVETFWFVS